MRKRFLLIGLLLLPVVLMAVVIQGFVRDVIVVPLFYVFWLLRLLFESISQVLLWGLFIVVVVIVAGRSLVKRVPRLQVRPAEDRRRGRVEEWQRLIQQTNQGAFGKWRLANALEQLAVDVLASQERLEPREIRRRLENGTLELSPEVLAYLRARMPTASTQRQVRLRAQGTAADPDLERVVQFLEERLR
ncbi:MAG TPA: hypothetical protein VE268_13385 [Herpetosiphonaceae bacterium]|nr:hypothetical protein [Herpetosiphonaceae bacterium]